MPYLKRNTPKADKKAIAEFCHDLKRDLEKNPDKKYKSGLCLLFSEYSQKNKFYSLTLFNAFNSVCPFSTWDEHYNECCAGKIMENKKRIAFIHRWARKHIPLSK